MADAMELDFSLPDDVPEYFQNILAKYSHANKKSRRSYSFTQKLALLNWIDYHRGEDEKPNWSQASKKTGIDRKTLREWDKDRDIINKQVQDVKKLGSSKKYGGSANRKRIRLQTPLHPDIERDLLVYFDTRAADNLTISRKILRKQAWRLGQSKGIPSFKGSKGFIHRFMKRNDIVPRTITGSGQQVPHNVCALCAAHIAGIGETQRNLGLVPRTGHNGQMDETPLWWSMASKKTLQRRGQKIITQKSSGHEKKRFSAVLGALDDGRKLLPMVIFKALKKVPEEVRGRTDCVVAVSKGGSMTPELMQIWIRQCWAKRPSATIFRKPNILGMDVHYSHVHDEVVDVLRTVCNTTTKFTPGGCTGIMAGPDTHWNKPFKGYIREDMETYMETDEYELTAAGKIKPAPYKQICDWVVAAWNKVDPQTIINSFVHNGWEQAFNGNDTSVLHQTLRDVVENNVVRGYQRRAAPDEIEPHNLNQELARRYLEIASDVDSDDENASVVEELDDFDFYRLQQEDERRQSENSPSTRLPCDNINFSESSEEETERSTEESNTSDSDQSQDQAHETLEEAADSESKVEFCG